ncbi:MAG: hypothetical protein LYZ69_00805 [Nitrososphaerales archaeon]|nr:hypothetical protein [Nitrososphaerales archaeon]
MSEPVRKIRRYVDRNYGDTITVADPLYYANQKFWVAELKSDYPRRIRDDKNNQSFVKFLTLRDLGEIRLTDDNRIEATPREELVERLRSRLEQWRETAQQIILSTSSEELAPLGAFKDSINPIVLVIRWLAKKGKHEITNEQLTKEPDPRKMLRWINFLVDIKLLQRSDRGFTYSNLFTEMEKETAGEGTEHFVNHVVAYIMKDYYHMIRQVFRVSRFETYLHMATCYYAPSIQAERMLYRNEDSLLRLYHKWYSKSFSDLRLSSILDELEHQKIMTWVDDYWYGSSEIWSRIQPLISTIPQVVERRKG